MRDDEIFAKCAFRLVPLMAVLFFLNFLDRVNVGFAALTMNRDLGFSPAVYGFGAGVLFLGYFLFQIPSNVILERVGARRWIFCIVAAWGAISAANALVQGPWSFYALRFLLGVAEAGYYPGMIYYLTLWFPPAYRARLVANFLLGLPLAFIIGAPVSTLILEMDGIGGLRGWQWMFLIEGLPAFLLAFAVLKMMPDGPRAAPWLSEKEKERIEASLSAQERAEPRELWPALRDPRVLVLGLVYTADQSAGFGARLWLPQIVQTMGFSNLATGFIVAIPFVIAMAAMVAWGRSSDIRGERVFHVALPLLLSALGFIIAAIAKAGPIVIAALGLPIIATTMFLGPFWGLGASFMSGRAAAGAIALVSAIGSLGGFVGPTVIGVMREETGGYGAGMLAIAAALVISALAVFALGRTRAARRAPSSGRL